MLLGFPVVSSNGINVGVLLSGSISGSASSGESGSNCFDTGLGGGVDLFLAACFSRSWLFSPWVMRSSGSKGLRV